MLIITKNPFFKLVKLKRVTFAFAIFWAFLSYIVGFVEERTYGVIFCPDFLKQDIIETIIFGIGALLMMPLVLSFFLRKGTNKNILRDILVSLFSIHIVFVIVNLFILILGVLNLLNSTIYGGVLYISIIWTVLLLILASNVLSGCSKTRSSVSVTGALIIATLICGVLISIPKVVTTWKEVGRQTPDIKPFPYTVKSSAGKVLSYNMNPLEGEPDAIRCITKEGATINVFLRIRFKLMSNKLRELGKRYKKLKGIYEPEMHWQITESVFMTIAKNYTLEELIGSRASEFKDEVTQRIRENLSSISIELIDLEIIKIEERKGGPLDTE